MSLISLLWPAFALAILLVFIHSMFGLEIIRRGVIFTDLAIGQFAAIGVAVSLLFFEGKHTFVLTLVFALTGAFLISLATYRVKHIEAFIGMLYALGASSIIVLLSNTTQGTELFNKLQATDILFTASSDLWEPLILYSIISALFAFFYPKFTGIAKEMLFFGLLALTVTSSVQLAGVLVVFVLLIVPAFISLLQTKFAKLPFSWITGSFIIIFAMIISYFFDLPTGYTIVFIASLSGILSALILSDQKTG
ncbi:metal ABC transporter permease [Sulfurovum sp. ST-21]|uniref:Metal ABC transporter permease n=1 Tax=Sulfurovum indicum TaxID=2779528 RepID=A0A7M1S256_9BACT|nr:metal ABC transporter permease [Sulfurovum indicum]QOR61121.1 metal ABC transporter permease [Sulfurovum indicum]